MNILKRLTQFRKSKEEKMGAVPIGRYANGAVLDQLSSSRELMTEFQRKTGLIEKWQIERILVAHERGVIDAKAAIKFITLILAE